MLPDPPPRRGATGALLAVALGVFATGTVVVVDALAGSVVLDAVAVGIVVAGIVVAGNALDERSRRDQRDAVAASLAAQAERGTVPSGEEPDADPVVDTALELIAAARRAGDAHADESRRATERLAAEARAHAEVVAGHEATLASIRRRVSGPLEALRVDADPGVATIADALAVVLDDVVGDGEPDAAEVATVSVGDLLVEALDPVGRLLDPDVAVVVEAAPEDVEVPVAVHVGAVVRALRSLAWGVDPTAADALTVEVGVDDGHVELRFSPVHLDAARGPGLSPVADVIGADGGTYAHLATTGTVRLPRADGAR